MDFRSKVIFDKYALVTVGLLSYNYSIYIEEALNSIVAQTYKNIQLIIIDDCSTDSSVEVISKWIVDHNVQCEFIIHKENFGICKSCNDILSLAEGKYITLFASDDIMNKERIERQVTEMEILDNEYGLCYSDAEIINECGEYKGLYSTVFKTGDFNEGNIFYKYFVQGFRIAAPTLFFKKDIFNKIGFFDENITTEDYSLFMKALPWFKIKFCNYPGIKYRVKDKIKENGKFSKRISETHHRDRILIYFSLHKDIHKNTQWKNVRPFVIKKINFHLVQLCIMRSEYFSSSLFYLIRNFFLKISFLRILTLQIKMRNS